MRSPYTQRLPLDNQRLFAASYYWECDIPREPGVMLCGRFALRQKQHVREASSGLSTFHFQLCAIFPGGFPMKSERLKKTFEAVRFRRVVIPAFNVPYLPIVEAITCALGRHDTFALIEVSRIEFRKIRRQEPDAGRRRVPQVRDSGIDGAAPGSYPRH